MDTTWTFYWWIVNVYFDKMNTPLYKYKNTVVSLCWIDFFDKLNYWHLVQNPTLFQIVHQIDLNNWILANFSAYSNAT